MDYRDIYRMRLERGGSTPFERIAEGRKKNFLRFLASSPHRIGGENNDGSIKFEGVLEPFRQSEKRTLMHLLVPVSIVFSIGDIVEIEGERYLVFDWDERRGSGYNRFLLLELTQAIQWRNPDNSTYQSEAHIYDQTDNMLKNELKSRSRSATLYLENLKLAFMIMPVHIELKIGSYLEIEIANISRSFRVVGFDFMSTPGVLYVSMDPTFTRDFTPMPEKEEGESSAEYFWGGDING